MCFSSDYPSSARIQMGLRIRPCMAQMNRGSLAAAESGARALAGSAGPSAPVMQSSQSLPSLQIPLELEEVVSPSVVQGAIMFPSFPDPSALLPHPSQVLLQQWHSLAVCQMSGRKEGVNPGIILSQGRK